MFKGFFLGVFAQRIFKQSLSKTAQAQPTAASSDHPGTQAGSAGPVFSLSPDTDVRAQIWTLPSHAGLGHQGGMRLTEGSGTGQPANTPGLGQSSQHPPCPAVEVQRCSREKDIGGDLGLCLNAPTDRDVTTPRGSPKCNSGHLRELESPFLSEEDYSSLSAPLTLVSNTEFWNRAHHRHRFDMHLSRTYWVLGNVVGAEAVPWKEALKGKAHEARAEEAGSEGRRSILVCLVSGTPMTTWGGYDRSPSIPASICLELSFAPQGERPLTAAE